MQKAPAPGASTFVRTRNIPYTSYISFACANEYDRSTNDNDDNLAHKLVRTAAHQVKTANSSQNAFPPAESSDKLPAFPSSSSCRGLTRRPPPPSLPRASSVLVRMHSSTNLKLFTGAMDLLLVQPFVLFRDRKGGGLFAVLITVTNVSCDSEDGTFETRLA